MKKLSILLLIALGLPIAGCIAFFTYTTSFFSPNSYYKWVGYFKDVTPPPVSTIIKTDDFASTRLIDNNDECFDYGIYWIIETDLTPSELEDYYLPYINEINIDHIGYKTYLEIHSMPDSRPFFRIISKEYMQKFDMTQYTKKIYIIYIYKHGIEFLRNA